MRAYLYGGFQDGSRESSVCTDINLGDRAIYNALASGLAAAGHEVDFVLPDEVEKITSLEEKDLLVLGGGGLFEGHLLDPEVIQKSKARKVVVGAGVNWLTTTFPWSVLAIQRQARKALVGIKLVLVRDYRTQAFLGTAHASVFPDLAWAAWAPGKQRGTSAAAVVSAEIGERAGETPIRLNRQYRGDLPMASGWEDFCAYNLVRTNSYHGMLFALMAGAIADVTIRNVKQEAFLMSYADHLAMRWNTEDTVSVSCPDPEWFCRQAKLSISIVVDWLRSS